MLQVAIKQFLLFSLVTTLIGCDSMPARTVGLTVDDTAEVAERQVTVHFANDGNLLIDGEACDIETLGIRARDASSNSVGEPQFVLEVQPETDDSLIVNVMSELSKVGIWNVRVVVGE